MPSSGSGSASSAVGSGSGAPSGGTSYSSPTYANFTAWTDAQAEELGLTSVQLQTRFTELLGVAEAMVALEVGESDFSSTSLTEKQVTMLQLAVCRQIRKLLLIQGLERILLGSEEPMVHEDGDTIRKWLEAISSATALNLNLTAGAAATVGDGASAGGGSVATGTLSLS